jgi:membrane protein insertase Oxa1/YidC/SpoIIIJ
MPLALREVVSAESLASHAELASSLIHGGALWFPDLTSSDATMILPITLGLVNLANIEVCCREQFRDSQSQMQFLSCLV